MRNYIKKASDILGNIELPSIPEEVIELKAELNKKYPNTVTVAQLIGRHPELLSDFLTLVNTSITQQKDDIKEAKAAVNILGLDEIYNIFFSTTLTNLIAQTYEEKLILKNGAKNGLAAAELSYWIYDVSRSEAYMASLMQNIGSVYLLRHDPEHYFEFFNRQIHNPITGYEKEMDEYQTTHCFMGSLVSKKWHVDPHIYKAIIFHHDLDFVVKTSGEQKVSHLTALMMLSNYIVLAAEDDHYITQELKNYRDAAKRQLNLPDNAIKAAISAVQKWGDNLNLGNASH